MVAMLHLGTVKLDAPFFQAGLAGYSDTAMRLIARRHGAPYCVTEAMLDHFLIHGGRGLAAARLDDQDHPIAGQLMGSHPQDIARGAAILLDLGYDVIDINLACPVKKVRKKARGGHLLSDPQQAIDILDAVRQQVGDAAPCTVKLRRGYDDSQEAERDFFTIFEKTIELGYVGAVVHCRSVAQKYLGPGRWSFLRDLTHRYRDAMAEGFVIGGSGDIWLATDIVRMIRETGVQLVSVARGCIGNPWIFRQARAALAGDEAGAILPPTIARQRDVLLEHFALSVRLHGERSASMMMRKFGIRFARHHPQGEAVRKAFIGVASIEQWQAVVNHYYQEDGPGVAVSQAIPEEAMDCAGMA